MNAKKNPSIEHTACVGSPSVDGNILHTMRLWMMIKFKDVFFSFDIFYGFSLRLMLPLTSTRLLLRIIALYSSYYILSSFRQFPNCEENRRQVSRI